MWATYEDIRHRSYILRNFFQWRRAMTRVYEAAWQIGIAQNADISIYRTYRKADEFDEFGMDVLGYCVLYDTENRKIT